jgi:hypothetical protein
MAAKRETGSRKPARNPVTPDRRLDDIRFYWLRLTETQRDRLYNIIGKLCENNELSMGGKDEEMPRVVLYDPKTKRME